MAKRWIIPRPMPTLSTVAEGWHIPPVIAQLLLNRGMRGDRPADSFLTPLLKDLDPPGTLPGATVAAGMIAEAIRTKSKIVLYGDYDVDGITGTAILWHLLQRAGAHVSFYVPHRVEEGYGLNLGAARRLTEEGAALIVTVDCGITAVDAADAIVREGTRLIITDHHAPHATLPSADAIVHPTVGGVCPNPHLPGAGVAFKLAWAIAQRLSGSERVDGAFRDLLMEMLPLAALGTIADVVPLVGENRIIARHGLRGLARTTLPGPRALIDAAGLGGRRISDYDVGFKLAPRLNAAGRMGHARLAVELLTRADERRAQEIALYLEEHNGARKATERQIIEKAVEMIERGNLASDARRAIVLASEGWHAGVIGIVAARIVDRYHRPAVLIALSEGEGQGSCRSIPPFNIADALASCSEHLLSYGGHAMAAGLRISGDRVDAFTESFINVANNRLTGDDLIEKLRIDAEMSLRELTMPVTEAIIDLGPFGVGNPRPKFATGWVDLADEPRCVGRRGEHLQASFDEGGTRIRAIGFGLGSDLEDLKHHRRCRVAFEPIINEFNDRRSVEMQIIDLQFPG